MDNIRQIADEILGSATTGRSIREIILECKKKDEKKKKKGKDIPKEEEDVVTESFEKKVKTRLPDMSGSCKNQYLSTCHLY